MLLNRSKTLSFNWCLQVWEEIEVLATTDSSEYGGWDMTAKSLRKSIYAYELGRHPRTMIRFSTVLYVFDKFLFAKGVELQNNIAC